MHSPRSTYHRNKSDLTLHLRISLINERPNIKPVPQENAAPGLKQIPRLLFRICSNSAWRDCADTRLQEPKRIQRLCAIQQNTSIGSDPFATVAPQYLEIVRNQSFVLFTLPQIPRTIRVLELRR